ncbi:MAG TPA: FxsA family protein [Acidimicrobiia bacterium]|jgi:UPF0716 protein FxsA|nr:FxsA family protein [Acidimicrobiia bacterium]HEV3450477.1 FxsA family protein [Acidimicrobiia bacterium]
MQRFLAYAAALAVVELVVIVEVAQRLGVIDTIGLLILVSIVGVLVVKAQGLAVLRRLVGDVEAGRVPGPTLADGALVVVAGALLVVPGFVTDVPGLLLLVTPVRRVVRRRLRRRWSRRFVVVRGDELEA